MVYAKLSEKQPLGTPGGTFTQGAWRQRTLNTIDFDLNGIVLNLSANKFILKKGKYLVLVSAPALTVNSHMARLIDDAGANITLGTSEFTASASNYAVTNSKVMGQIESDGVTPWQVEHRCSVTHAINGFGISTNLAQEQYTNVLIQVIGI